MSSRRTPTSSLAPALALLAAALVVLAVAWQVLATEPLREEHAEPASVPRALAEDGPGRPLELSAETEAGRRSTIPILAPAAAPAIAAPEAPEAIHPAEQRIRGFLRSPDGARLAGTVALFPRHDSSVAGPLLAQAATDAEGVFAIGTERTGELMLLACVAARQPVEREIVVVRGRSLALDLPIVVPEGPVISGSVRAGGEGIARCEMVAILDRAGERYELACGPIVRAGGSFARPYATAESDAEGRFTIRGLSPDFYQVRVSTMRGGQAVLGLAESVARDVRAPADGIDFEFDVARLRLRFVDAQGPVAGLAVHLSSSRWRGTKTTDQEGEVLFRVLPRLECELGAIQTAKHMRKPSPLLAPGAGKERLEVIELERYSPPADLVLEISSRHGQEIDEVRLVFEASGRPGVAGFTRAILAAARGDAGAEAGALGDDVPRSPSKPTGRRGDGRLATLVPGRSRFLFKGVPAGPWRVTVHAGAEFVSQRSGNRLDGAFQYCDAEILLDAPRHGVFETWLEVVPRPYFEVLARAPDGAPLAASCTLVDALGERHAAGLYARGPSGRWRMRDRLDPEQPTRVYARHCSGPTVLELSAPGFRASRIEAELSADPKPPLEVVLERE